MLTHLHIRDFAIVSTLELDFEPQLTVVTGETGAGKSIVIEALSFALGERADSGVIRHGCRRAEITASFALDHAPEAAQWLEEHDLADDGACLLRRVLEADKPSKGYINGRPAPIQLLRELGELLVDIHGQHEHHSLLKRDEQRRILDAYGELGTRVGELETCYREWRALSDRHATLAREGADRNARVELLRYQVSELKALALSAEEIPAIEEEHKRLANANELLTGAQQAAQVLYDDDDSVSNRLAQSQRRLESLGEIDPRLAEAASLVSEAQVLIDEAGSRLHGYLDDLELDPARLAVVEERLATIHQLARKHRLPAEELPALLVSMQTELGDLEDYDNNLGKLESEIAKALARYREIAGEITRVRAATAKKLGKAVSEQLPGLGMPGGRFEVALEALPENEPAPHGMERIEFRVSANPGQPLKPLTKVASGGELSRISLALQVITARLGRIPTLVFDEVDVGIGGGVAEIVGQQLRALAAHRQVLCITHLAQVASQGQHHLQVHKQVRGAETHTTLAPLAGDARVQEIARMLGGVEITRQTLALATDMLDRAAS